MHFEINIPILAGDSIFLPSFFIYCSHGYSYPFRMTWMRNLKHLNGDLSYSHSQSFQATSFCPGFKLGYPQGRKESACLVMYPTRQRASAKAGLSLSTSTSSAGLNTKTSRRRKEPSQASWDVFSPRAAIFQTA